MKEHQAEFQSNSKGSVNPLSDFVRGMQHAASSALEVIEAYSLRIFERLYERLFDRSANPYAMKRQVIPVPVTDEPRITRKANPYN
jgi:hypothetical protein